MRTLARNILIGLIIGHGVFSVAKASLLPMNDKLSFAQMALTDQLGAHGFELIKVDISEPEVRASIFGSMLKKVTSLYSSTKTAMLEHVRFKARDLSSDQVYQGWVYLQTRDVTNVAEAELTTADNFESYTQVLETSDQQKIWIFLSDSSSGSRPMLRSSGIDLHLIETRN